MRSKNFAIFLLTFSQWFCLAARAVEVSGSVSRLGDSTHMEFAGSAVWIYEVQRTDKTKVVMTLGDLSPDTVKSLREWSDPLIKKVSVASGGVDGAYVLTFELAREEVKAFDYLTDQPSRLILDFYEEEDEEPVPVVSSDGPAKSEVPKELPKKKTEEKKTVSRQVKVTRKPAGTDFVTVREEPAPTPGISLSEKFMHGIYDGADPNISRFRIKDYEIRESAIRESRQNIFLEFPMLDLGTPPLTELQQNPPIYEIIPKETEENKIARLLHVLYRGRKHAMFTKTVKYFREKYPESEYEEMIGFMEADLHYFRWQQERAPEEFANAMAKYRVLTERFHKSPLAERTFLLMGYSYLKKNDLFGSLKTFQRFLRLKPKTEFRDQVQLAIAKNLLQLNRFEDALHTYRKIEKNGDDRKFKVEAKYLQGDVYFKENEYKKAVQAYEDALQKYPRDWSGYPNAFFNMGESLFWSEDYKRSMDAYIEFLKRFPSHDFGGYAMTRLGELLEILGADNQRVMGAFLESYFRYRSSQGGDLARARILSGRMKEMKGKEIEDALAEFDEIVGRSELPKIDQFVKIKIADGFHSRGEFDKAIDILTKFYQNNPTKINTGVFTSRIINSIAGKIRRFTEQGQFLDSMKVYNKYKKSWLKNDDRLDIAYDQGKSYELAGVYKEAAALYRKTLNRLYSLIGTPTERSRSSFEKIPSADELNLRLAAVNLKLKGVSEANNYLKEIKNPKDLSYQQQIELVEIASQIAEARNEKRLAVSFLSKLTETWQGQPELVSGPYLRLAELQESLGRSAQARNTLQRVLNLVVDTKKVDPEHHYKALYLLAKNQEKKKSYVEAMKTYEEILRNFESQKDLDSVRYHLGQLYFERENLKEAEQVWSPLVKKEQNLWAQLAKDKMEGVEWRRNYSKYIDRIPAMKDFGKKE